MIDLNVSFTSSDCSMYDLDLDGTTFAVPSEKELIETLQISFDDSLEFIDLDMEVFSNSTPSVSCSRPHYITNHLEKFLHHNLKFNSSYKNMENMAKVLNTTPNTSVKVPSTAYMIKKCIPAKIKYEFQIKCPACSNFITSEKNETLCTLCNLPIKTSKCDYFVTMNLQQQLKLTVEKYFDEILAYGENIVKLNTISDLHNANVFKTTQKKWPLSKILPLIINTDGVKVFRGSTDSLWLIQISQAFLPPEIRFIHTNILILAAHFGKTKPKMHDFFYPVLKELHEINQNGGMQIIRNGKEYKFVPLVIGCCCDLPAKDDVQGMVGFSGYNGCGYCLHPGISVKGAKIATVRYTKGKGNYELRNHNSFIKAYERLRSTPINGIKTISCMIAAPTFDLVDGFAIDAMHCVHLGVMKKLMKLWLESTNKKRSFFITKPHQILLSNKIVSLKPVSEIIRRPRSIFKRGDFKANEYRNLLFYYLPIALDGLLDNRFIKHFRLLSSAIYILSKKNVTFEDINQARMNLNEFADSFENLYDKSNVTMNLHLLRHLSSVVENLGPLWCHSAYAFEAKNGIITRANNSTNQHMVQQLAFKYTMNETIKYNIQDEKDESPQLKSKSTIRIGIAEKFSFAQAGLDVNGTLSIYRNVVMKGIKFSSKNSKEISTIDYFVRLNDGQIACIQFFTVLNSKLYLLVDIYEADTVNSIDHFIKIELKSLKKVIEMNDILEKMIYLKFARNEYVTVAPNHYEKT